jgi:hypothetical protein
MGHVERGSVLGKDMCIILVYSLFHLVKTENVNGRSL